MKILINSIDRLRDGGTMVITTNKLDKYYISHNNGEIYHLDTHTDKKSLMEDNSKIKSELVKAIEEYLEHVTLNCNTTIDLLNKK